MMMQLQGGHGSSLHEVVISAWMQIMIKHPPVASGCCTGEGDFQNGSWLDFFLVLEMFFDPFYSSHKKSFTVKVCGSLTLFLYS